jgi:formate/nitrite transporter FocA (FNT family)
MSEPPATSKPSQGAEEATGATRMSAEQIHENIREPAEEEMARPFSSLFVSALAAGLLIGFSFLSAAFAGSLVGAPYRTAARAAAYPLGFIFVVLGRNELFTENTLEPIIPLLHRKDLETLVRTFRLWGILLLGNLVGALIFALALAFTPVVRDALVPALRELAVESVQGGFWRIFYGGIFAGWLLALLTWLLAATRATGAQIVLIWLCTAPILAFEFKHSIAGSVEAFYAALTGSAGWGAMLGGFVVPTVLGNALGGVVLVALLNHGQVAAERADRQEWRTRR